MRYIASALNLAVAGFLIVWGAWRIAAQLGAGEDLEVLPFVSGALGLVGLLVFIFNIDNVRRRGGQRP